MIGIVTNQTTLSLNLRISFIWRRRSHGKYWFCWHGWLFVWRTKGLSRDLSTRSILLTGLKFSKTLHLFWTIFNNSSKSVIFDWDILNSNNRKVVESSTLDPTSNNKNPAKSLPPIDLITDRFSLKMLTNYINDGNDSWGIGLNAEFVQMC